MTTSNDLEALRQDPEALWNPTATVNWSLPFSPAFGSWLQMLNWQALGEPELAEISKKWFYASLAVLFAQAVMGLSSSDEQHGYTIAQVFGLVYLLIWYYGSARPHLKYVKERFGNDYNRRPWKIPLLFAAGIMGMLITLRVIVGIII